MKVFSQSGADSATINAVTRQAPKVDDSASQLLIHRT